MMVCDGQCKHMRIEPPFPQQQPRRCTEQQDGKGQSYMRLPRGSVTPDGLPCRRVPYVFKKLASVYSCLSPPPENTLPLNSKTVANGGRPRNLYKKIMHQFSSNIRFCATVLTVTPTTSFFFWIALEQLSTRDHGKSCRDAVSNRDDRFDILRTKKH